MFVATLQQADYKFFHDDDEDDGDDIHHSAVEMWLLRRNTLRE